MNSLKKVIGYFMKDKWFLKKCEKIKKELVRIPVSRAFNSIGSNVFFEFGKNQKITDVKGEVHFKKEWSIWLGNISWRITKEEKFLVGSGDSSQWIQSKIPSLLGKFLKFFNFTSQFLDVSFCFEDGYCITTFLNWMEEDQWTIFLPDLSCISLDVPDHESIKEAQEISDHFLIKEDYYLLDLDLGVLQSIDYHVAGKPILKFNTNKSLHLKNCAWRLEKNREYLSGCLDSNETSKCFINFIDKKVNKIEVSKPFMDGKFTFEDGYILRTFNCSREKSQWKIKDELDQT